MQTDYDEKHRTDGNHKKPPSVREVSRLVVTEGAILRVIDSIFVFLFFLLIKTAPTERSFLLFIL